MAAEEIAIAEGTLLYVHQDPAYVWLCVQLPAGSYGVADLRVEAPGLAEALNLHVSAQLGEWPADRPEAAPTNAASDQWWNHQGWAANALAFGGMNEEVEPRRARFRASRAREMQLAKERFGRGLWKLRLKLGAVAVGDGQMTTYYLPSVEEGGLLEIEAE